MTFRSSTILWLLTLVPLALIFRKTNVRNWSRSRGGCSQMSTDSNDTNHYGTSAMPVRFVLLQPLAEVAVEEYRQSRETRQWKPVLATRAIE